MRRLSRLLPEVVPWLLVAVAGATVGVVWASGRLPDPAWRMVVVGAALAAAVAAWRHRVPLPFVSVMLAAAARLAVTQLPSTAGVLPTRAAMASDVAVGVVLGLLLLIALQRRYGRLSASDRVDFVAIVIGASLVAWVAVGNPLVGEHGHPAVDALLAAAYLPIAALLVAFTIDVLCSGLERNRSMWFVVAGTVANLAAAWFAALGGVGALPDGYRQAASAGYAVALFLLAAALSHRDVLRALEPRRYDRQGADGLPRLVVMGVCVLVPVGVVAALSPTSPIDASLRITGVALLVVAVGVRLTIATRQNREARDTLLLQVTHDDLTRLPTRSRFADDLADVLETTWRSPQRPTVIQLNLDRFKNINDSFGHYTANEVLVVLADRLRTFADSIGGVAGRVGGDDFAILDPGTTSEEEARGRADDLIDVLAPAIDLGDAALFLTASIGVATAPRHRTIAAEELMRHADIATHQAKQEGRNRVAVFDESMQARITRRMDVEHALHGAIGRQEMHLYHQPIVDIVSGRISGFEALMRWQRQDGSMVSPADFIPVAEETGIICELGAWALRDALRSLRNWIDDGVVGPTITMSVNASPRQVADPNFAWIVRAALDESGVPAHLLWLEITESMMLDEPERVQDTLTEIRSLGVRIALDDFGTGFSSLSVLQRFPIQRIKIDRAFVQGMGDRTNDRSLVRTIIAMAQSMALDLVAEGVETVEQLEGLRELGCEKAQGFLISRPVPADAIRSTMVAINELASLSLFGADGPEPVPTATPRVAAVAGVLSSARLAQVAPIVPMPGRPLGGPRL